MYFQSQNVSTSEGDFSEPYMEKIKANSRRLQIGRWNATATNITGKLRNVVWQMRGNNIDWKLILAIRRKYAKWIGSILYAENEK